MDYVYCKTGAINTFTCVDDTCINFRLLRVKLDPTDKNTKDLFSRARDRFEVAELNDADSGAKNRTDQAKKYSGFIGFVAEEIIYQALILFNEKVINNGYSDKIEISLDDSNTAKDQVDIRIKKSFYDKNKIKQTKSYTVEIRSSMPAKDTLDTVCRNFDILGPYFNAVKPSEIKKDFYIRGIFDLKYDDYPELHETYPSKYGPKIDYKITAPKILAEVYIDQNLNLIHPLDFYIPGGATNDMMDDDALAYNGKMENDKFKNPKGFFRKIKLHKSLDAVSIISRVLSTVNDEHMKGK